MMCMPACSCCLAARGSVPPTMRALRMDGAVRCRRMSEMTSCTCCARSLHTWCFVSGWKELPGDCAWQR